MEKRTKSLTYIKPKFLQNMETFARFGTTHSESEKQSMSADTHSSEQSDRSSRSSQSNSSTASSLYSSASAMQRQTTPRHNNAHDPQKGDDGKMNIMMSLFQNRNNKHTCSMSTRKRARTNRAVVAAAAANQPPRKRKRQTLMDSGAGLTVCNVPKMYIPGSIKQFPGEVMWGDGSTRAIKYAGEAPGIGQMINTGGEDDTTLMSVGTTLTNLTEKHKIQTSIFLSLRNIV